MTNRAEENRKNNEQYKRLQNEFPIGSEVKIKQNPSWKDLLPYIGKISTITRHYVTVNGKCAMVELKMLPNWYVDVDTDIEKVNKDI